LTFSDVLLFSLSKKKELIIKDKRSDNDKIRDVDRCLKLNSKIDNSVSNKNDYNDYIQPGNDEVVVEPLLQSPIRILQHIQDMSGN
jgi:hypothetical protein